VSSPVSGWSRPWRSRRRLRVTITRLTVEGLCSVCAANDGKGYPGLRRSELLDSLQRMRFKLVDAGRSPRRFTPGPHSRG
jgi:hypothetical protein